MIYTLLCTSRPFSSAFRSLLERGSADRVKGRGKDHVESVSGIEACTTHGGSGGSGGRRKAARPGVARGFHAGGVQGGSGAAVTQAKHPQMHRQLTEIGQRADARLGRTHAVCDRRPQGLPLQRLLASPTFISPCSPGRGGAGRTCSQARGGRHGRLWPAEAEGRASEQPRRRCHPGVPDQCLPLRGTVQSKTPGRRVSNR